MTWDLSGRRDASRRARDDALSVLIRALLAARRRRRYRIGLAVAIVSTIVAVLMLVH